MPQQVLSCLQLLAIYCLQILTTVSKRSLLFLRMCNPSISVSSGTEAQQRAALHSHILLWFRRRLPKADWTPLKPIPRTVKGKDLKQRDKEHEVPPQVQKQEDNIYHLFEAARISGEMPRPFVGGDNWGGYDTDRLRVAGLARHCLERLNYMHVCTPHYCLKNRSSSEGRKWGC